jgi:acyl carrier protein
LSARERLTVFLADTLEELGREDVDLRRDTSLLRSGLLDSLGLLRLAGWIEEEVHTEIDLKALDLPQEWDTIDDVLRFIGEHG